jgi:hypothetical protein
MNSDTTVQLHLVIGELADEVEKLESEMYYWQTVRGLCCDDCKREWLYVAKRTEDALDFKCFDCHQPMEHLVLGNFEFNMNEPKTLGSIGEQNYKKLGHYRRSEIEEADKPGLKRKERSDKIKKIGKMDDKKKLDYIMTGKM